MTISEDRLLAYADGLLSPEDAVAVERELETDTEAQALLDALRASDLPYREAVETSIPVPDLSVLEARIRRPAPPAPRRRAPALRYIPMAAAIALFFVAGIFAGRHVLPPSAPEKTQWARWVDEIASYQALYTRETLSLGNPPADRQARQMNRVSDALGKTIPAPDLSAQKADFKYARMYALEGEPLAQIAYLPEKGKPFSICLMKTAAGDHGPRYSKSHGLNVATWRKAGIAWVFVGETSKGEMERYIEAIRTQQGA